MSRALSGKPNVNDETRQRVVAEAERLGYRQSSVRTRPSRIGLAYTADVGRIDYGAFDSALMRGVLRGVDEQRFDVIVVNLHRDKLPNEGYGDLLLRKGVHGLVLRTVEDARRTCIDIAEEGVPSIVVADRFDEPGVNYVCTESRTASRRAVEHLLHLGHRRIALGVHRVADTDHRDRIEGYREALDAGGVAFDAALVADLIANTEGGANAIAYLMSLPNPPTAVYFTDPLATLGALQKCRELDVSVPEDLSVVGFDDSDVRHHSFPVFTAVCQDAELMGFEAAQWLTRSIMGAETGEMRRVHPGRFEINGTTAAPRRRG